MNAPLLWLTVAPALAIVVVACSINESDASAPVPANESAGPGAPLPTCSTRGTEPLEVRFRSERSRVVSLYWVNERCDEIFSGVLGAGLTASQSTFVGHVWRVREGTQDAAGAILKEFVPQASDAPSVTVVIPAAAGEAPTQCSLAGTTPANLTVINQRSDVTTLYWVDRSCNEVLGGRLPRGKPSRYETFVGHKFRVREGDGNAAGAIVKEFSVGASDVSDAGAMVVTLPPPDGGAPPVCSSPGGAAVKLTVTNKGAAPVSLYWVDGDCAANYAETIAADAGVSQNTFVGHAFEVRAGAQQPAGALLKEFVPQASDAPSMNVSVP